MQPIAIQPATAADEPLTSPPRASLLSILRTAQNRSAYAGTFHGSGFVPGAEFSRRNIEEIVTIPRRRFGFSNR